MIMYIFNSISQISRLILKNSLQCCWYIYILVAQIKGQTTHWCIEGEEEKKTSYPPVNPNLSEVPHAEIITHEGNMLQSFSWL